MLLWRQSEVLTREQAILRRLTRVGRRSLILEATHDAQGGANSVPESEFLRLLRSAGLPLPRLQVRRRDSESGVRYLDGYYEQWHLHVEIDGAQHMEPRQYWADMRRQNAVWIPGDRILRFPSWAIRHRPREVEGQIREALLAAGWRP
jgi:very-short-patch-repair endonuclease